MPPAPSPVVPTPLAPAEDSAKAPKPAPAEDPAPPPKARRAPRRKRDRKPVSSGGIIKLERKDAAPNALQQRLAVAFARPPGPPDRVVMALQYGKPFRRSQQVVLDQGGGWLQQGQHQLHVVAPPGSGKTILGLEMVRRLGRPALVLAPNTAIQMQWVDRCADFLPPGLALSAVASADAAASTPIRSLTYQSLTTAKSDDELIAETALQLWRDTLIESRQLSPEAAAERLARMREANADDYRHELTAYKARVRNAMVADPDFDVTRLLHDNARALVTRMVEARVGTVVLDECHHLSGMWALVVGDLIARLDGPVVIGLTATPPIDRDDAELSRYLDLVGDIDSQIPTPAVVKEGNLAPYQDLVLLTRPTAREEAFIASQHEQFAQVVRQLVDQRSDFLHWLHQRINLRLEPDEIRAAEAPPREVRPEVPPREARPEAPPREVRPDAPPREVRPDAPPREVRSEAPPREVRPEIQGSTPMAVPERPWPAFAKTHPGLAEAGARLLVACDRPLAPDVPQPRDAAVTLGDWAFVLEDYALNRLKLSDRDDDHALLDRITTATRALGLVLTESGFRAHMSPVDRVLALSASKIDALIRILGAESKALGPELRALVLTDFEKTSATATREVEGILDAEAGGAFAVIRALVTHADTDPLDAVLVTGSAVICDADLAARFVARARQWLEGQAMPIALDSVPLEGLKLHEIRGQGPQWNTRTYVRLVTALFEEGLTRCLVGTRGLLGEGWDALSVNTLVDLTAVTAFMTTNQVRGRSLRVNPRVPRKVADNWDVVCVAPQFEKGFNDYQRFVRKHLGFHGLCDDGQIASGVSHVHPALTRGAPKQLELDAINEEMLARPSQRARVYDAWKVGEPYRGVEVATVEVKLAHDFGEPPVRRAQGLLQILGQVFASKGHTATTQSTLEGIATAVLLALQETKQIDARRMPKDVTLTLRSDGFYRVFLADASAEEADVFAASVLETLSPLADQRYLIPRYEQPPGVMHRLLGALGNSGELKLAQWHAVPERLGTNKETAEIFARHWNDHVSPGQPVFARRPEGQKLLAQYARQNPMGLQSMQRTVWQ